MAIKAEYMHVKVMPDRTVRFCDGKTWYDSFQDYLSSFDQRDFEADLWRDAGRKPDAVATCGGEQIEIYHS
jgi:hypothetical protein